VVRRHGAGDDDRVERVVGQQVLEVRGELDLGEARAVPVVQALLALRERVPA